jgi:hypothetical protein
VTFFPIRKPGRSLEFWTGSPTTSMQRIENFETTSNNSEIGFAEMFAENTILIVIL